METFIGLLKLLVKSSRSRICLYFGIFLIGISFFDFCYFSDVLGKNWKFVCLEKPRWISLGLGLLIYFVSVTADVIVCVWRVLHDKKRETERSEARLNLGGRHSVVIRTGRIENSKLAKDDAVVLPINTALDDTCLADSRTSTGAFITNFFPHAVSDIAEEIRSAFERKGWVRGGHVDVGAVVFFPKFRGTKKNIIFSAVTNNSSGIIHATPDGIIEAMTSVFKCAAEHRISALYMPVLGSGHGGVNNIVALLAMVYPAVDIFCRTEGHMLRELSITVFDKSFDLGFFSRLCKVLKCDTQVTKGSKK